MRSALRIVWLALAIVVGPRIPLHVAAGNYLWAACLVYSLLVCCHYALKD